MSSSVSVARGSASCNTNATTLCTSTNFSPSFHPKDSIASVYFFVSPFGNRFIIMLSSATRTLMRRAVLRPQLTASFATVKEASTVSDALKFSGYSEIDFTIPEDAKVYDAVQKFAAYNIGCLVVTDAAGT